MELEALDLDSGYALSVKTPSWDVNPTHMPGFGEDPLLKRSHVSDKGMVNLYAKELQPTSP